MLKITNLVVNYGPIQALRGVNLEINLGEVVSIIGGNGAGKSTLMKTISGLESPVSGSIVWQGNDITQLPAHKRVRLKVVKCSRTSQ